MFNRKNIIYIIGDSHANFFSGSDKVQRTWPYPCLYKLPYFESYRLGPVIAYNLCQLKTKTRGREKVLEILRNRVPKKSIVLLCFGEIDCRAHLLKEAERQNKPIIEIVQRCVNRYFSVVLEIRALGYFPSVWNVLPTTSRTDLNPKSYEFPTYGSQKQRNHVTELFNRAIGTLCKAENIPFISIYDKLVDHDGNAIPKYFSDGVHLCQHAMPLAFNAIKRSFPEIDFDKLKYTNNKILRSMLYYKRLVVYKLMPWLYGIKTRLIRKFPDEIQF